MKKFAIASILTLNLLYSSKIEWGHGTFELEGGFLGLNGSKSCDIDSYSILEHHKNILGTNFFYGYNLTYFDSQKLKQLQTDYNLAVNSANTLITKAFGNNSIKIPEMEYRFQGIDAGVTLGYDLIHKSDSDYLGLGLYGGLSVPYIKSDKSSSSDNLDALAGLYEESETDITTYKVGIGIYAQKSLAPFLSLYSNAIYAYQTGNIKNNYANLDFDSNGKYYEVSAGLKFQALKADLGLISPSLYGTLGWRYRKWQVDDVGIDISGASLKAPKSDMKFSTNVFTLGVGYSF
jgi:opacity protein-like surface antigen